jgi:predicted transcriptional regulator
MSIIKKKKPAKNVTLSVRISEDLDNKLQDIAIKESVAKSQVVTDLLEHAIKDYEKESDQK